MLILESELLESLPNKSLGKVEVRSEECEAIETGGKTGELPDSTEIGGELSWRRSFVIEAAFRREVDRDPERAASVKLSVLA